MQRHHGEVGFVIPGRSPKPSLGDNGLQSPARTICLLSWNVERLDLNVMLEGVVVEKDSAHTEVSHGELPRDVIVLKEVL